MARKMVLGYLDNEARRFEFWRDLEKDEFLVSVEDGHSTSRALLPGSFVRLLTERLQEA